jgi:hypothetical protein
MRLAATVLALAALALVLGPAGSASAAAYKNACATEGDVLSGHVIDMLRTVRNADGTATPDDTSIKHPKRNGLYGATEATELHFGGVAYELEPDTVFSLNCAGEAGSAELKGANLDVGFGRATLHARSDHQDGISGDEGAAFNYADKEMEITVTRELRTKVTTLQELLDAGPSALRLGKTIVEQADPDKHHWVGITPYIGRSRRTNGQCHYAHSAILTSTRSLGGGFVAGTVDYGVKAPFSPK